MPDFANARKGSLAQSPGCCRASPASFDVNPAAPTRFWTFSGRRTLHMLTPPLAGRRFDVAPPTESAGRSELESRLCTGGTGAPAGGGTRWITTRNLGAQGSASCPENAKPFCSSGWGVTEPNSVYSRRHFLDDIGRAGGAIAVYHAMTALGLLASVPAYAGPPALAPDSGRGVRVVILGAGIAGLVSALELRKAGYDLHVLEARERPGGRVFTVRRGTVVDEIDSRQRAEWDDDPDLYLDAGAARLPQNHQGILSYARELGVKLEVLSNENRNAWLHAQQAFGGKPQRNSRVHADSRGFVAELAAKALDRVELGRPVTLEDMEKLRRFLADFGALDSDLVYRSSPRAGYIELPGAGDQSGKHMAPLDLEQLMNAGFWSHLAAIAEAPQQAPTMLRPVGGMSKIPEAMARSLGRLVTYGAEVTRLRRTSRGARVEWRDTRNGEGFAIEADHVLVTIQPGLLGLLDQDFSQRVREALAAPETSPFAKVGFQAKRRFWELDEQIYGGISWTDHSITQIWYPSQGIHARKGLLVGAYVFRDGEEWAKLSPRARLDLALEGGELLHPGYSKQVEHGVSISWRKARYSSGATTHWSDQARKEHYPVLLEPDGPYSFAGEYLSYINGWQEGALRSAHHTLERLASSQRHKQRNALLGKKL
jgi:monoamine oxidase